jgi:hypothetical protein
MLGPIALYTPFWTIQKCSVKNVIVTAVKNWQVNACFGMPIVMPLALRMKTGDTARIAWQIWQRRG